MTLFNGLLIIHIISGCIAVFSSLVALSTSKGKKIHRLMGRYFFYSMTGIFFTAIPMSIIIHSSFLFCIAIFSYYLAWTGWRYALRRELPASKLDILISLIMLSVSFIMVVIAIWNWEPSYHSIVLLVFGIIGGRFSINDLLLFRHSEYPQYERIIRHVGGMIGATIAVFTAVLVVNVSIKQEWVLWFIPTLFFLPFIIYWVIRIKKGQINRNHKSSIQ